MRPTIKQLTDDPGLESQHTYYDICPWSHDSRYIVYSSAPTDGDWSDFGHDTLACREGSVHIIDTETLESLQVAENAVYLKHGGAFCIWHPSRRTIYFRQNDEEFARLDVDSGKKSLLSARIRQLSPDGARFAVLLEAPHGGGQGAAVGVVNEDGSDCRELVRREQLYDLTPNRDNFRPEDMMLGNTKWHPGGKHLLVTMWTHGCPGVHRSLYVISCDGSEARWLTYFGHHHSWTPDGSAVLFNDRTTVGAEGKKEWRMMLVDFDGANRRIAFDEPVGSHPRMCPDCRSIVDADREGIYLVDLVEKSSSRLATFACAFEGSHHGTHPHPVWNKDGSQLIYNSAESGHSEIYQVAMSESGAGSGRSPRRGGQD